MPDPVFTPLGDDKNAFIAVDDQINWAIIPAYTLPRQKHDMPIRLRVGDQSFGDKHIYEGHSKWLEQKRRTACELIWEKLSLQGGKFYKGNKNRKALYVNLDPHCLIVLEPQQDHSTTPPTPFYSVVTMYQKRPKPNEKPIGQYSSNFKNPHANRALRKG